MFSSQKCKYFACDLIFRMMNKFFHTWRSNYIVWNWWTKFWLDRFFCPWILMSNIKETNRNSNISFIRFKRWTSQITALVWSIQMPSFDYLKDVYIIFIQQMRYKNSHKQRLVERHTNQFEQTLKLFKCEEKVNYLHDFCSWPSIWILRINS